MARRNRSFLFDNISKRLVQNTNKTAKEINTRVTASTTANTDILTKAETEDQIENLISNSSISTLSDVSIANVASEQVLQYNANTGNWENETLSLVSSVDGLTDTNLSNVQQYDYLKYDGSNWINSALDLSSYVTDTDIAAYSNTAQMNTAIAASNTAMKNYVDAEVSGIINSAPTTLDTLNELAAALGDDPNFATTTATNIGTKLAKSSNLSDLTNAATARTNLGLGSAATTASTDYATSAQGTKADTAHGWGNHATAGYGTSSFSGAYADLTGKPSLFSGAYADLTGKPTIPTNNNQLTNGAGYITGITSSMVTTALGFTPGTSSFSGAYADLSGKPTIPTNNNQLTNGAGYLTSFDITTQTDPKYLRSNANDTGTNITLSSLILGDATLSHSTSHTWKTLTIQNAGDNNEASIHGLDSTGTQQFLIYGGSGSQGFLSSAYAWRFKVPVSGSLNRDNAYTLWDSGNDGSGSGLDADLLDGQDGSYYLNYNNLSNKPTIPTNNNQLTNGAGYITSTGNTTGYSGSVKSKGNYVLSASTLGSSLGDILRVDFVRSNDGWPEYGTVISARGYTSGGGGAIQFYAPYGSGYGGSTLQYRLADYSAGTSNPPWTSWKSVWDSSNDGSGSGLDADLLDGSGWLDYTRDIHANQVIADDWLRTTGNTGWYNNTYAGGWYMTDTTWIRSYNNKSIYQNVGTLRTDGTLQVGGSGGTFNAPNGGTVTISGSTAWHAGNDGSGSGLDADTVDGIHASSFARSDATWTSAAAWRQVFHSGSGGATFGSNHYSMGVDVANGGWNSPNYSDLIIGYHTGIRIGGGYSGIRFYNNSPTTDANNDGNGDGGEALLMTIGGGGTSTSGANVTINNDLYMGDNVHVNSQKGFVTSGAWIRNQTAYGYIDIGPANTGHAHIYTDRSNFYFNKSLIYANGNTMWHAGNDGSGSGLDADLLDGLNSASFLRSDAATSGTTITATDAFRSDRFENGAGSFMFRWGTNTGTSGIVNFSDTTTDPSTSAAGSNAKGITWGQRTDNNPYYLIYPRYYSNGLSSHTRLVLAWHTGVEIGGSSSYGGTRFFNNSPFIGSEIMSVGKGDNHVRVNNNLYIGGNTAWHAGNDGSGSGLDADLLDGQHASSFVSTSGATFTGLLVTRGNPSTFTSANDTTLSIRSSGTSTAASMSFHRPGAYAVNLGLDTDNHFKLGGWSMSTVKHTWQNNGTYLATGDIYAYYSDERLKTKQGKIENAIDKVNSIETFYYTHNDLAKEHGFEEERMQIGVSAQTVEKVMPEVVALAPFDNNGSGVSISGENYKTVQYEKLVPLLIEAIKEQQAQIEELKEKLK